tara:strand:- start:12205 stop:12933 length:729 start_codon:yes stop_codon:yes gene_type:complete
MKKIPISIITACFNSENTIQATFNSLLNQTSKNFEHIIIDGGSTDKTKDLINLYIKQADYTVIYKSEPDDGLYDAMNKGIKLSNGTFIGILSSDDWYEKNAIESILSTNLNSADIIYGFLRLIKDKQELMVRRSNLKFIDSLEGMIQHPSCFVRKENYLKAGLYDTSYKVCADQDLFLNMIRDGAKLVQVDNIIANFTMTGTSYTVDSSAEIVRYKLKYNLISKKRAIIVLLKCKLLGLFKR